MLRQLVFEYDDFLTFQRNLSHLVSLAKAGWSLMVCNRQRTNERHLDIQLKNTRAAGFDFDDTLIAGIHFRLLTKVMSEADRALDESERDQYFSAEQRSDEWVATFIARGARRLRGCLTKAYLDDCLGRLPIRPGAVDLAHYYLDQSGVLINTLGAKPFVERWCERYLELDFRQRRQALEIAGLEFTWDTDGECNGFVQDSIVTDGSKGKWFSRFCQRRSIPVSKTLVLGDSPRTDKSLLRSGGVRVLLWPVTGVSETSEADRQQFIPDLWPDLDAVLIGDSLEPLVQILRGA